MMPMTIFFGPKSNDFSRTLVHKTATSSTDSKLHDLTAMIIGKLVLTAA